jgi:hypothetical protein
LTTCNPNAPPWGKLFKEYPPWESERRISIII